MKLIAHRANLNGPNPLTENSLEQIEYCIERGYDVEIDVRLNVSTGEIWLGHDEPQYNVSWTFLEKHLRNLWIHCKDIETLQEFSTYKDRYNYFWHQEDDYTLTSQNYIWTYPGKSFTKNAVIVMPELDITIDISNLKHSSCFGICSDYVGELK